MKSLDFMTKKFKIFGKPWTVQSFLGKTSK